MIYADYNGTAPINQAVKEYLINRLENEGPYANPNAIHFLGSKCLRALETARQVCADVLGARPDQVFFNSGASEGISTMFHSAVLRAKEQGRQTILISQIEHAATITAASYYEKQGMKLVWIPTHSSGVVDLEFIKKTLGTKAKDIAGIATMAANNETGVIQPYQEIAKWAEENQVLFLCDTTQLIGKGEFNFATSRIDFAVCSGHKLGSLPGSGLLLAKHPTLLQPIVFGGGQELGKRGGTQNYIGAETLAVALKNFQDNKQRLVTLSTARRKFEKKIKDALPEIIIFGEEASRLTNTTFLAYPGVLGQAIQIELESKNIFITTSSACSDNEPVTSKVLHAMNISDAVGRGAIRISLGLWSDPEDYDKMADAIILAYLKLLKIQSY
ncbi:MAG: aminotransferase class V-fold PLP-dependent enzyme [Bdellovibrio sp.]|nr:aminotransferase class V-fold PLP-dependent enzyme [Bdellovibrio sp.]